MKGNLCQTSPCLENGQPMLTPSPPATSPRRQLCLCRRTVPRNPRSIQVAWLVDRPRPEGWKQFVAVEGDSIWLFFGRLRKLRWRDSHSAATALAPSFEANLSLLRIAPLTLALLFAFSTHAPADRLITEDGRIIDLVKARKTEEGYHLVFHAGDLIVGPEAGIASIEIEGDMADYVPQNDDEKQKLEDGYVRFRGKWMIKARYLDELKREFEASQERTAELAAHSKWSTAWERETKHFMVKSNTSQELLDYYSDLLEAYYSLMNKQIGIKPTLSYRRKKMGVNIYKSHKEFQELSAAGVGPSTLGYFWSADDTLNFFHDYEDPARSEWVALHECTHLLTFLIDQQYDAQIWLNEAVADYYGSSEITKDKRGNFEIEPGLLQTDRILTVQQAFKDDDYTRLEKLFTKSRAGYTGFHYAHGWSLVYFIHNYKDGKHAKAFTKFFKDLYTLKKGIPSRSMPGPGPTGTKKVVSAADIRDLLLKAIKYETVEELEKDWKEYIAAIPIESGPALLKRGLNRTRSGEWEDALVDLDGAIEAGVTDPRAWASRAVAKVFTSGIAAGIPDMEIAVKRAPLNATFHFRLSQLHVNMISTYGFDFDTEERFDSEKGKQHAGLASELDPQNDNFQRWYEQFN